MRTLPRIEEGSDRSSLTEESAGSIRSPGVKQKKSAWSSRRTTKRSSLNKIEHSKNLRPAVKAVGGFYLCRKHRGEPRGRRRTSSTSLMRIYGTDLPSCPGPSCELGG